MAPAAVLGINRSSTNASGHLTGCGAKIASSSSVCWYVWSMETHSMSMADEIEPLRYTDILSLFEFGAWKWIGTSLLVQSINDPGSKQKEVRDKATNHS